MGLSINIQFLIEKKKINIQLRENTLNCTSLGYTHCNRAFIVVLLVNLKADEACMVQCDPETPCELHK
jgi:hypothetical protein